MGVVAAAGAVVVVVVYSRRIVHGSPRMLVVCDNYDTSMYQNSYVD